VKLSRSDKEAARWQAELDGLAERAGASPNAADTASRRSQSTPGPLEGYWTATSEIGDGPWQVEDELSSIRLGNHGHIFTLEHIDAQQEVRHQTWGEITQPKYDQDGSGTMGVDLHE